MIVYNILAYFLYTAYEFISHSYQINLLILYLYLSSTHLSLILAIFIMKPCCNLWWNCSPYLDYYESIQIRHSIWVMNLWLIQQDSLIMPWYYNFGNIGIFYLFLRALNNFKVRKKNCRKFWSTYWLVF